MRHLVLVASLLLGCTTPGAEPLDPERFTDEECLREGENRCRDAVSYQTCRQGLWYVDERCEANRVCNVDLGCVQCDPISLTACDGDDVRACGDDGLFGEVVRTCAPGQCQAGYCQARDCPEGTDLIYVVDRDYRLWSFNPADDLFSFSMVGDLSCPAGAALPGWGGLGGGTPFSMSVDRGGQAWVLYTSGQVFRVDTANAAVCAATSWSPGTQGFELFGMGFVAEVIDPTQETLYTVGGSVEEFQLQTVGRLGALDPISMDFSVQGPVAEYGAELTGTGHGQLWAYFPGQGTSRVARLDRDSGASLKSWVIPGLPGVPAAWAFAHWGGQFFLFISHYDELGGIVSRVLRFDPGTGDTEIILENTGIRVVGAGVSTCAPTVAR
jgi:hypothetical protein